MILKRYLIGILLMTGFLSACTVREFSDDNGLEVAEKDSIRINIQIKSSLVSSRTPVIDPEDDTPANPFTRSLPFHNERNRSCNKRCFQFQAADAWRRPCRRNNDDILLHTHVYQHAGNWNESGCHPAYKLQFRGCSR